MTITVLDLENWSAQGATAELVRKTLGVRLSFRLNDAPEVRVIAAAGHQQMTPTQLVVAYAKTNDEAWEITSLRMYGRNDKDESVLNVYPHDNLHNRIVPAWVRDAAYDGMPK